MTVTEPSLLAVLLVGVGGTLGALSRFGVDTLLSGPRSVLVVNVVGSVALGALAAASPTERTLLVLGTGYCGAFTTFSSFAVTVAERARAGDVEPAVRYAGLMLVGALVGVALGSVLGREVGGLF